MVVLGAAGLRLTAYKTVPVSHEVVAMSERVGWVCVASRYRDKYGHEALLTVAEFHEDHVGLAQEMADRLNVRELAASQ